MDKNYYISKMEFEISIPVSGKESPVNVKDTIEQLVYASDKEKAREAVINDIKKQYPDTIIYSCRIHDTIIGD